jgi:hypothetical protein
MFKQNLFNINQLLDLNVVRKLNIPQNSSTYGELGDIRYNNVTKKMQYYDGTTWQTLDSTSPGLNFWETYSTSSIKPISGIDTILISTLKAQVNDLNITSGTGKVNILSDTYVNSIGEYTSLSGTTFRNKVSLDDICEKTTNNGVKINNTLKCNDITSYGTNANLNFNTDGTGSFIFNCKPTYPASFQIMNSTSTHGEYVQLYIGKTTTDCGYIEYVDDTNPIYKCLRIGFYGNPPAISFYQDGRNYLGTYVDGRINSLSTNYITSQLLKRKQLKREKLNQKNK